ncbi:anthranilate phosphoribosyltransferase [Halobacillus ihumii]|uniref:anthranilate phosphoribosyltransferase n=1 Tax=Halobacillus ihumii TaxID=2686092 RepID=UPI0013D7A9CB|nr:anthranilate phosphoribosyltransferase [Halobacillus ihumii]
MQNWLKEVARGKRGWRDLTYQECLEVANDMINGKATSAQISAFLIAQRLKTESPDELLAFVHALRKESEMIPLQEKITGQIIDFAGPYNGRNSFIATIPVSILLAEKGLPVFLHSSDSLPPKYGISLKEIIEQLGVEVNNSKHTIVSKIEETGLGFACTEKFSPFLSEVRSIREDIGVRTLLNTSEKLLNLSQAKNLMMGAFHRTAIHKIVPLLHGLSYEKVFVLQGVEGSEDLPVHRNSFLFELTPDSQKSKVINPDEFGLLDKSNEHDKLSAEKQVEITLSLLSGERNRQLTYYYNQVLLNTGLRYYLFGVSPTIKEGIEIAEEQLSSGNGIKQLDLWKGSSQTVEPAHILDYSMIHVGGIV